MARPLATPVTSPPVVTLATPGASDCHPVVTGWFWPFERVSLPVACVVCPIRSGVPTVTLIAVVVEEGAAGDPESSPQAASVVKGRMRPRILARRDMPAPFADEACAFQ